jgi:hypothetical protein
VRKPDFSAGQRIEQNQWHMLQLHAWVGNSPDTGCALRGLFLESVGLSRTAHPAVFLLTERLFLELADRVASVVSSRPVRRMVAQSNP